MSSTSQGSNSSGRIQEILDDFALVFADALQTEYNFVEKIACGLAESRKDFVDKHLDNLFKALNFAASSLPGGFLVDFVHKQIASYRQKKRDSDIQNFQSDLFKYKPDVRALFFEQIANEVMMRYGPIIAYFLGLDHQVGNNKQARAVDVLARSGAMRIIYTALYRNINFECCDKLVSSLVRGFDDFPESDRLSKLCEGVMSFIDPFSHSVSFSAEDIYTRCGFCAPDVTFKYFIHADYKRQSGVNGQRGGYVVFTKASIKAADSQPSAMYALSHSVGSGVDKCDKLIPQFGYACVPSDTLPANLGYRVHRPALSTSNDTFNVHLPVIKKFQYRYISLTHIIDYLKAMQGTIAASRPTFSDWLTSTEPYKAEFTPDQAKLVPVYRGVIDGAVFSRRGVDFVDGIFAGCDFSSCSFLNVTIGSIYQAKAVNCVFFCCVASGTALSGANLSKSRIENCNFENLKGILKMNYCDIKTSSFAHGKVNYEMNGITMDAKTLDSFSTCYDNHGHSGVNRIMEQLKERLLLDLEEKELAKAEERDTANKAAQRQIWEDLAQSNSMKGEADRKRDEETQKKIQRINERLDAFDKATMSGSMSQIVMPSLSSDSALSKVFEVLFFLKPMKLLKLLMSNPSVVKWNSIPRTYMHSTNGANGEHGADGDAGQRGAAGGGSGSDGSVGVNGQHGTSATPNTVCLMSVPDQRIFVVSPNHPVTAEAAVLPLYDEGVAIHLSAKGGLGGNGGRGGKGGDGTNGINGQDATSSRTGSSGTNGGNGGRGGNGGSGGNAGHSADITVMVKPEDMDLLYLLATTNCEEAKGGTGGAFGLGGAAGSGGYGGSSYTYTRDGESRTNAGGSAGANGVPGQDGRDGPPGINGKKGNVVYAVIDTKTGEVANYHALYNLVLQSIAPFYSVSGIIEPGQIVEVNRVLVKNTGGMVTPEKVLITLCGNTIIVTDDDNSNWKIEGSIGVNHTHEITEARYFKINESVRPEAVVITTDLVLTASLPRICKQFASFMPQKISLNVEYPVEISMTAGVRVCVYDTHVPVLINVRNKCRVGLGLTAAYGRLLRVVMDLPLGVSAVEGNHVFRTASGAASFVTLSTDNQVVFNIDYLAPQGELTLYGTLAIRQSPNIKLYDMIQVRYCLLLGSIDSPLSCTDMRWLQQKTHHFQVAEYCAPLTEDDCLLVISSATTAEEVDFWKSNFSALGKSVCVFNVSLYNGLSYDFPSFNFNEKLSGKIVVILNAPFLRDDTAQHFFQPFYPLDYLEKYEIFESARRRGLRTLVVNYIGAAATTLAKVGLPPPTASVHHTTFESYCTPLGTCAASSQKFDGRTEIYKHIREGQASRDEQLPAEYLKIPIKLFRALRTPTEIDFDSRMDNLSDRVEKVRPDQSYYTFKEYQDAVKGEGSKMLFWKRYEIGGVELRRGLDTTYATVASLCISESVLGDAGQKRCSLFLLLKLLPFAEKLRLFVSIHPEEVTHATIIEAVMSDLADECSVFTDFVRSNGMMGIGKAKMLTWLSALTSLEAFDFSEFCRTAIGTDALVTLLCRVSHMANHFCKAFLLKKTGFIKTAVLKSCETVAKNYLANSLPLPEYRKKLKEFADQQKATSEEDLMRSLKDPQELRGKHVLFNHWITAQSNVISTTATPNSPPSVSLMRSHLPDITTEAAYKAGQALYSSVRFYPAAQLPTLYPVHPEEIIQPESPNKQSSYYVSGTPPNE